MATVKLTDHNIRKIDKDKESTYTDPDVKGFTLATRKGRTPVFYVFEYVNGKRQKHRLGSLKEIGPGEARRRAKLYWEQKSIGSDIFAEKKEAAAEMTLSTFWETVFMPKWTLEGGKGGKPPSASSLKRNEQVFRLYLNPKLGAKRLSDISINMLDSLKADMAETPIQFNRTLAALTTCMNWAINKEDENQAPYKRDPRNPCKGVKQYPENKIVRALTKEERTRYLETCHSWINDPMGRFEDKVLAYWALTAHYCAPRLTELLHAEWSWIKWNRRVIELPYSKTGQRPIPLSQKAIGVLRELKGFLPEDCPFLFPGRPKGRNGADGHTYRPRKGVHDAWKRFLADAKIENYRRHDVRHTWATVAIEDMGLTLEQVGKQLGHSNATTTELYGHLTTDTAVNRADEMDRYL